MRSPVRRRAAIILAATLALPFALRPASPAVTVEPNKLSSAMRGLVAQGGYKSTAAIAEAVRGFRRGDIYYLAEVRGTIDAPLLRSIRRAGAHVRVAFPEINWVAVASTIGAVSRVAALDRVARIEVDGVQRLLSTSVEYVSAATAAAAWGDQAKRGTRDVGAEALWTAGIDGSGVTIGVADSGVDATHPDLNDLDWRAWGGSHPTKTAFVDCSASLALGDLLSIGDQTIGFNSPDLCLDLPGYDDNGHGTHVSGIATGTAQGGAGQEGLYPGMAPGSLLSVAKVCNAGGTCLNSSVMAGMRYLALEKSQGGAGADIVNMSLGGSRLVAAAYGLLPAELETNEDPQAQLLNALSLEHNTLFVIAAGNSGPVLGSVANPAGASQSLAVGASVADYDLDHPTAETLHGEFGDIVPDARPNKAIGIAGFSSRGPSGDRLVKPDVVAPGVYIVAPESLLGAEVHAGDLAHGHSFSADPRYAVLSGTSMASPSAAGVAALVLSGARAALGDTPAYYQLKAALANTAGTKAYEGSVIGLIFGTVARNGLGDPADLYPIRNDGPVGATGVGAGRVNAPAALLALTKGVVAYTPQRGALDDIHELQPSWALDDLTPGGSARTTFLLHGASKMQSRARVTFRMATDPEPAGMRAAPSEWFSLPGSATAVRGRDVPVSFGLRVPSNAAPGAYEATILGTVELGRVRQAIRIPVQFFVRMTEPNAETGGSSIEGPIWASDVTDYSLVGFENPIGDIYTDWPMFPLYLPAGTERVDFSVYDVAGEDLMDLFVFDQTGHEIDSTVSTYTDHVVPAGLLYLPTTEDDPARMSILADSPDGNDTSDAQEVTLPTTVWIAVSDTGPASVPTMSRYHLDVDMIGAASTGISERPAPRPRPRPDVPRRPLPATGLADLPMLGVMLLLAALAVRRWRRVA